MLSVTPISINGRPVNPSSIGATTPGTATFSILTMTGSSGGNTVVLKTGIGSGGFLKELVVQSNETEQNSVSFQNLKVDGYSASTFRTYQGNEVLSVGYSNPSASVFGGLVLIEVSDANNAFSGLAPAFVISQFSNFTGSGAAGHFDRFRLETDGTINFKVAAGGSAIYFTIAPTTPVFTFGTAGSTKVILDATSGGSQIQLTSTTASIIGGATSLFLRGCSGGDYTDRTCEILVRESGGRSIVHRCFGGTLAQGGHQFLTGGTFGGGGQTQRFQISDDGVQSSVPISFPGYTVATLPTPAAAGAIAYVTDSTATVITGLGLAPVGGGLNKVPVFYNGTGWVVI